MKVRLSLATPLASSRDHRHHGCQATIFPLAPTGFSPSTCNRRGWRRLVFAAARATLPAAFDSLGVSLRVSRPSPGEARDSRTPLRRRQWSGNGARRVRWSATAPLDAA